MTKKILIAEDEKPLRDTLTSKLKDANYEVVEAKNGHEVLEKIKIEKPDLILLDIVMPEKNGFEILEDLRIKQNDKTPVIVLSNLEEKEDVERGKNLGISEYITKSDISLNDLVVKIHSLVG